MYCKVKISLRLEGDFLVCIKAKNAFKKIVDKLIKYGIICNIRLIK
jgi:hypothetical protein